MQESRGLDLESAWDQLLGKVGGGTRWPMVSSVPACVMMLSGHSSSADLLVGSNLHIIMNVSHLVLTLLGERTEEVLRWRYPSIWLCLSLPWAVSGGSCPLTRCKCDDQHHTFLCSMIYSCKLWKLGSCSEVFWREEGLGTPTPALSV